jgi:hypothetical protein
MKFRQGFVSNSSSTSFVIYGWKLPIYKWDDAQADIWNALGISSKGEWENRKDKYGRFMLPDLPRGIYAIRGESFVVIGVGVMNQDDCIVDKSDVIPSGISSWKKHLTDLLPSVTSTPHIVFGCMDT